MKIYMKGVLHWDPFSRERLIQSLSSLRVKKQGHNPKFVAIESSPGIWHDILANERPDFIRRATANHQFDNLCPPKLSLTLGYEVDSHSAIFESTTMVWLDKQRDEPGLWYRSASGIGKKFYDYLSKFLNPVTINDQTAFLLAVHENQSVESEQLDYITANERDAIWYSELSPYLADQDPCSYAVAVVGRDHLAQNRETLRVLLERRKFPIDVEDVTELRNMSHSSKGYV